MKFYLAPMEGITGYIYRNALHRYFRGVDRYFTPFIAANSRGKLSSKEMKDICPEHNLGMELVPQLLTNCGEDFIRTSEIIAGYGYREVNLNLGCPSKTVVSKCRGSGFLSKPDMLDRFLNEIFEKTSVTISIKTRIGMYGPEEFYRLIEIYNKYPVKQLIVHPRTQADYYKNRPDLNIFREALSLSQIPLCYNGDLFTSANYTEFCRQFPEMETVMLGRGLLMNPGLADSIKSFGDVPEITMPDKKTLLLFHDEIYHSYIEEMIGQKPVLFKMKELWFYISRIFTDSKKYMKKIKKAESLSAYEWAVNALFEEQEVTADYDFHI